MKVWNGPFSQQSFWTIEALLIMTAMAVIHLVFTPVPFLLLHFKMSCVEEACCFPVWCTHRIPFFSSLSSMCHHLDKWLNTYKSVKLNFSHKTQYTFYVFVFKYFKYCAVPLNKQTSHLKCVYKPLDELIDLIVQNLLVNSCTQKSLWT